MLVRGWIGPGIGRNLVAGYKANLARSVGIGARTVALFPQVGSVLLRLCELFPQPGDFGFGVWLWRR